MIGVSSTDIHAADAKVLPVLLALAMFTKFFMLSSSADRRLQESQKI